VEFALALAFAITAGFVLMGGGSDLLVFEGVVFFPTEPPEEEESGATVGGAAPPPAMFLLVIKANKSTTPSWYSMCKSSRGSLSGIIAAPSEVGAK